MRLLGIILGGDWTGAASAMYEAGVTAKAELKSQVGVAAEVERGKDQLQFVDIVGFTCTLRRKAGQDEKS